MNLRGRVSSITFADRLLIVLLVIIPAAGILFINDIIPAGSDVVIEVEGTERYRYPLRDDRTINIKGRYGSLNVEIKERKVRVTEASCSNKLCERQGWIERGAIVCLPARVTVTVGGQAYPKGRSVDAVTG